MDYSKLTKEEIINSILEGKLDFNGVPENLKNDKNFICSILKINPYLLSEIPEQFQDDKDVVLEAVNQSVFVLQYASDRCKDNKDIVMLAVKQNGICLMHASNRLKDNKEIVLEATKKNTFALKHASENLQNDKDLLEFLEKQSLSYWNGDDVNWYKNKMEVLASIREKELIESVIVKNNNQNKKLKF